MWPLTLVPRLIIDLQETQSCLPLTGLNSLHKPNKQKQIPLLVNTDQTQSELFVPCDCRRALSNFSFLFGSWGLWRKKKINLDFSKKKGFPKPNILILSPLHNGVCFLPLEKHLLLTSVQQRKWEELLTFDFIAFSYFSWRREKKVFAVF